MRTEIFECDRCHKKATTTEECELLGLGEIRVEFKASKNSYNYYPTGTWFKEVCRTCRADLGVLEKETDKKTPVPVKELSFDDMIREIVREELHGRTQ